VKGGKALRPTRVPLRQSASADAAIPARISGNPEVSGFMLHF
jgi:hypothetical protein